MKKIKIKPIKIIKRVTLKKEIRISVISLLGLLILASSYTAFAAYQEPTTVELVTPTYTYAHTGNYDYIVHLKDNSLYNTKVIYPGGQTIFKKIVDNINGSFTYYFNSNKQSEITGTYKITGHVQTSLWSKDFIITPQTSFNSNSNQAKFSTSFPLNLTIYEDYVAKVNAETGATASDSKLVLETQIMLSSKLTNGSIREEFAPTLEIPLGGNIIEINENLTTTKSGSISKTEEIDQPGVESERSTWTSSSVFFAIALVIFALLTKSEIDEETKFELELKKIDKKYGEWIIKSNGVPPDTTKYLENITVSSLDDLIKISEEIAKPIIQYTNKDGEQIFYVYDENIQYTYNLAFEEKN